MSYRLNTEDVNAFNQDGYLIVKNFFSLEEIMIPFVELRKKG